MDEASWHDWTTVEKAKHASTEHRHRHQVRPDIRGLLLPAEDVFVEVHAVVLVNIDVPGTLLVTSYRLLFLKAEQICNLGTIPLATIDKFSKQQAVRGPRSRLAANRLLQIVGKDMRTIVFGFQPHEKQRKNVFEALQKLTKPARLRDLYAFSAEWAQSCAGLHTDPRSRLQMEFERIISHHRKYWTLSDVNSDYMLCPTYPSLLVMPRSLSNEAIQQGADFRARGRLPTLSWQHPDNGAVLARSSQPLIGIMMNSRSNADEKLVAALCGPGKFHNQQRKLYIADARPRKNALANGAMGGGSESSANYAQCEVVFLGIDNIHAMRDSLGRLREYLDIFGASSDGTSSLLRGGGSLLWGGGNLCSTAAAVSALGDSGWLAHAHSLLAGAAWIAARIAVEGASVLVHCSDGWDRTTQLVSLAQIMLDPYYRTFDGLQALIEKDWLAFGHPFADRLGMPTVSEPVRMVSASPMRSTPTNSSLQSSTSYDNSPIFLQWIDCIAHLLRLYPRAFQYSAAYLVDLVDEVLSCRFGNFLCNSEKERLQAGVGETCACIWTYFRRIYSQGSNHKYYNQFYRGSATTLLPPAATLAPSIWPEYYFRWIFRAEKTKGSIRQNALEDDIQEETRSMFHRLSSTEQCKSHAEDKVQALLSTIDALKDQLESERAAHAAALADASRARKETASIKHAAETMGCKINFPNPEETFDTQTINNNNNNRKRRENRLRSQSRPSTPDLGEKFLISVDVLSGIDISANQLRKGNSEAAGNGGSAGNNGSGNGKEVSSCNWPRAGCPRLESSLEGLLVDYEALEQLAMDDRYFGMDASQQQHSVTAGMHSPGIT